MKFKKVVIIFISILLVVINCTLNSIKNKIKNTEKTTPTDFLTDLFLEGNKNPKQNLKGDKSSSKNNNSKKLDNFSQIENWLMISSPNFKNSKKFPKVKLPSGQQITIQTDNNNFRINSGFTNDTIQNNNSNFPPAEKYFWFRLTGKNLYYSSTKSDVNILGAISVNSILSVQHLAVEQSTSYNGDACFLVQDNENQDWKLCAQSIEIRNNWVCKIQEVLGAQQDPICSNDPSSLRNQPNKDATVIVKKEIQPVIIIPIPAPFCNEGWNYKQSGADWQCDCSEGHEQSPIDLPKKENAIESPIKPLFQYEEIMVNTQTSFEGQVRGGNKLKLELIENSLRIKHPKMGRIVTLDGAVYYAQELVIHTPAEHQIDGKKYDMELQIIHYGQTKGDIAKQVVLSFIFQKKAGIYNKFIDDLDIFNLPNRSSKDVDLVNNLFIPKILYSSNDQESPVMKPFSFYTYQGSIPFPPCTEKTIVYVASRPIPIGTTALQLLQEALREPEMSNEKEDSFVSDCVPKNNRNVQPLNGRPVFHYDHEKYCGPDPVKPSKAKTGHFEKVKKNVIEYIYVNDNKPSGIPGSLVVSEKEALGKDI